MGNGLPKGLTNSSIADLYSNRRQKGIYEERLGQLIESDEPAVNPYESWPMDFPEFVPASQITVTKDDGTTEVVEVKSKGKSPTTIYQGFRNAANKLPKAVADDIDVIQRDGEVFVAIKSRVMPILAAMSNGTEASEDDEDTENESTPELVEAPELETVA